MTLGVTSPMGVAFSEYMTDKLRKGSCALSLGVVGAGARAVGALPPWAEPLNEVS